MAGAFGGLLASAILKLDHVGGLHSWRMIFVIEGVITIGLSIISFFTLTDRPATARWLTQDEKDMAIARIKSERVGQTKVLDTMDKTKLKRGITSPVTLSTAFVFMLNNVTVQGLAFFAPTIVRTIYPNKSTITQQLFTVPPYVVGFVAFLPFPLFFCLQPLFLQVTISESNDCTSAFFTVLLPLISWFTDRRQIFMILAAPMVMIGYIMFLASENSTVRYAATFLVATTVFALGPISNAQVSANVVSDTARSSAIGTNGTLPPLPLFP